MATSISILLVECLSLFNVVVSREGLVAYEPEVPQSLWLDELGRLRVWAANIGAHQTGQSSLDYRLRDASHLKDQIIRLLERLQRLLVDLSEFLDEILEGVEAQYSDDEDATELEQIYNGLVEVIGSLFQMSMLIRRPAHHDRLLGTKKEDSVTFEPYDRQHVLEKYPRANNIIVDRLGSAISRRRADLKYRERHHAKLSQGINRIHAAETQEPHDRESTIFSETVATEYQEPNIQFDETGSQSGFSQTSYAPTLLEGGNAITVPPPPKEAANEEPFECPYCFFITTIKNKRSWARHVFRDIMPYICIFGDCSTPNRLYDSRREWYQHLTNSHISPSGAGEVHECPLCHESGFSTLSLERHLGRHLEELALFAMPRTMGDETLDSDRSRHSSGQDASSHKESIDSSSDEAAQEVEGSSAIGAEFLDTLPADVRNESNHRELASQTEGEEEEYHIKCICNYAEDDGNTVYCDKCDTWQHIECYYTDEHVPENHLCAECKPRTLDRKGARERQNRQREQRDHVAHREEGKANYQRDDQGLRRRRGSFSNSSTSSLYINDAEQEIVDHDTLEQRNKATSEEVAKQLARWNESTKISINEYSEANRSLERTLRDMDQSHAQHALPKDFTGNPSVAIPSAEFSSFEESRANRATAHTPRQNTPVENTDKYESLLSTESLENQDESGTSGHGQNQGALSSLKRLFGFGSRQESSKTDVAASSTATGKTFLPNRTRERNVEQDERNIEQDKRNIEQDTRNIEQDETHLRSGRDDFVPLPPRIRHIDSDSDSESYRRRRTSSEVHELRRDSLDLSKSPSRTPTDHERADADVIQGVQDDKDHAERAKFESTIQPPASDSDRATGLPPFSHGKTIQRNVSFVANTLSRPARDDEVAVMRSFAAHASHCSFCADPYDTYLRGGTLCDRGNAYARDVAQYIYNKSGRPYSVIDRKVSGERVQVEIPASCKAVRGLIKAADRGLKVKDRTPVVRKDKTYPVAERRAMSEEERMNRRDGYDVVEIAPRRERRRAAVYAGGRGSLYKDDEEERRRRRDRVSDEGRGSLYENDEEERRRRRDRVSDEGRGSLYENDEEARRRRRTDRVGEATSIVIVAEPRRSPRYER